MTGVGACVGTLTHSFTCLPACLLCVRGGKDLRALALPGKISMPASEAATALSALVADLRLKWERLVGEGYLDRLER